MNSRVIIYSGLIALSYYMIYLGAVGIKLFTLISSKYQYGYGGVPADQYGYPIINGTFALVIMALGGILFAFSYLHMSRYYQFKGILSHRHCEKTSFLWVAGVIAVVFILFLMAQGSWTYPMEWFYLAILTALGGYLGVIYYRITNRKKILSFDSLKFWSAKS